MDYSKWPEILPMSPEPRQPNPNLRSTDLYLPPYPSNPNPISLTAPPPLSLQPFHDLYAGLGVSLGRGLRQLPVDAYASLSSYPDAHFGIQPHPRTVSYSSIHRTVDTASYGNYSDPISHNWAAKGPVQQYEADPVGYGAGVSILSNGREQFGVANPNFNLWVNSTRRPRGSRTWKTHRKKMTGKTKIVQSAHCEVCKINCDTKHVLDKHKLGKKHKKNLEKLNEATGSAQSASESNNSTTGSQEPPDINDTDKAVELQKRRKKAAESEGENLETKRQKVLKGGAAAEAVRTCAICNVVCNSETVYRSHLAGQKHATMMKKDAAGTRMATGSLR